MKYPYKIISYCLAMGAIMAFPSAIAAQEDAEPVLEPVSEELTEPIIDAGDLEVIPPSEDLSVTEDAKKEITPLSEASIPAVMIHVEQLSWNTFKFRPSYQLGAREFEYQWDFGDGSSSNDRIVEHTFAAPGSFRVALRLDDDLAGAQTAAVQLRVGFFNLANWRLWVLMLILAAIIVVMALITGMNAKDSDLTPEKANKFPDLKQKGKGQMEKELEPLAQDSGEIDSLASTGMGTAELSEELALLESLDKTSKDKPESADMAAIKAVLPKEEGEKSKAEADVRLAGVDSDKLDKELDQLLAAVNEKESITPKTEEKKKASEKKPRKNKKASVKKARKKK